MFDTAEVYGFGRSERILGEALRAAGGTDDVVVATKVFPVLPTAAGRAAARRGQRAAARRAHDRPLPGALAATRWSATRTDDARHAGAARRRASSTTSASSNYPLRRWQRAEVDAGRRRCSPTRCSSAWSRAARWPTCCRGRSAPGTSSSPTARSPRACCRAGTTPTHRPTNRRPRRQRDVPAREPARGRPAAALLREVGGGARRDAGADRAGLDSCTTRTSSRSPGRRAWRRWRATPRRRRSRWPPTSTAALTAAAEAFRPTTGVSAIPALVRARRSDRSARQPAAG